MATQPWRHRAGLPRKPHSPAATSVAVQHRWEGHNFLTGQGGNKDCSAKEHVIQGHQGQQSCSIWALCKTRGWCWSAGTWQTGLGVGVAGRRPTTVRYTHDTCTIHEIHARYIAWYIRAWYTHDTCTIHEIHTRYAWYMLAAGVHLPRATPYQRCVSVVAWLYQRISELYRDCVSACSVSEHLATYQCVSSMYHIPVSCGRIRTYQNDLVCTYPFVSCRIWHNFRRGVYRDVSWVYRECIVLVRIWVDVAVRDISVSVSICKYLDVSGGIVVNGIWRTYHMCVSSYLCRIGVVVSWCRYRTISKIYARI